MKPAQFAVIVAMFICGSGTTLAEQGPNRATVSHRLKHYEGLMQTLQCDYENRLLEATPEQAKLIKQIKGKQAGSFTTTQEDCQLRSGSVRFWRKGLKQRVEKTSLQNELSKMAFDGQIVRGVNYRDPEGPLASINTAESADWFRMPREDPMGFLYLFYERPFSEVIGGASAFSSAVASRGKDRLYRVSVTCGQSNEYLLDFLFDDRFMQLERIVKYRMSTGRVFPFHHKLLFSDYRSYETSSGETLRFPSRVVYIGYNGTAPGGASLEVRREEYLFSKVQFNIDIPDKFFELEIPKNAKINDGVTGLGWLPRGERPAALFPAEARARRLWTAAVVLTAVLVVTGAVFYVRKRRRPAVAKS